MKITAEEIESLGKIVDYSIEQEERHYIEWITDEEGNYIVSKMVLDDANKDIDKAVDMLGKIEDKCDI